MISPVSDFDEEDDDDEEDVTANVADVGAAAEAVKFFTELGEDEVPMARDSAEENVVPRDSA